MKRALPFLIIAAVFVAAMGWGAWLHHGAAQPTAAATPPAENPFKREGPRDVATIDLYGDYQCPPCGELHPILKSLQREYGARMKIMFHHLPLIDIHEHAFEAAQAAVAAELQGKFWEMHDLLYENQSVWSEAPEF